VLRWLRCARCDGVALAKSVFLALMTAETYSRIYTQPSVWWGWTTPIKVIKYFISRRQQLTSALARSLPAAVVRLCKSTKGALSIYLRAPHRTKLILYNYINIHPRSSSNSVHRTFFNVYVHQIAAELHSNKHTLLLYLPAAKK
jgi:hypothetical protein